MDEIEQFIEEYTEMLPTNGKVVDVTVAEDRASKFLMAQARLVSWRRDFSDAKVKLVSSERLSYASAIGSVDGKNVTEKKLNAEADKRYIKVREDLEYTDTTITYLKSFIEIFGNAHVFYRQLCRDNG